MDIEFTKRLHGNISWTVILVKEFLSVAILTLTVLFLTPTHLNHASYSLRSLDHPNHETIWCKNCHWAIAAQKISMICLALSVWLQNWLGAIIILTSSWLFFLERIPVLLVSQDARFNWCSNNTEVTFFGFNETSHLIYVVDLLTYQVRLSLMF